MPGSKNTAKNPEQLRSGFFVVFLKLSGVFSRETVHNWE